MQIPVPPLENHCPGVEKRNIWKNEMCLFSQWYKKCRLLTVSLLGTNEMVKTRFEYQCQGNFLHRKIFFVLFCVLFLFYEDWHKTGRSCWDWIGGIFQFINCGKLSEFGSIHDLGCITWQGANYLETLKYFNDFLY